MIMAILFHTPVWVWALFIGLIYLGLKQTKDRQVSQKKAFLMPVLMIALSLHGVISSFGENEETLFFWGTGFIVMLLLGLLIFPAQQARFDAATQSYFLKGSWQPLCVILGIFFTKYCVGVMEGMHSTALQEPTTISTLSLLYGVFSGFFAVRAIRLWRLSLITSTATRT